jgi:rubrerythrin
MDPWQAGLPGNKEVPMANTEENLHSAFAGESQANRKYLFFAEQAEKEGQRQVARLFRAVAEAETVHARTHLNVLKGIGTTVDNLKAAASGESYEFTQMYPGFIEQAKAEGSRRAQTAFEYANAVEKIHHSLYQQTAEALVAGKTMENKPYFVCQVCGYTVSGEAPEKCPVCGAPKKQFKLVE